MKIIVKICAFATFSFFALTFIALAESVPRLFLSGDASKLEINEEIKVDVMIDNSPAVYGADIRLSYDPAVLEVLDADPDAEGVQVQNGEFINAKKSFVLANRAENAKGVATYALSLLNPAPSAEGSGAISAVKFRAKAPGQTAIRIQKGELGTRDGKTILPDIADLEISIQEKLSILDRHQPQILMAVAALLAIMAGAYCMKKRTGQYAS